MNTDELAPLFESRETRLGRLPEEARVKLTTAAESAKASGLADFEDQQFVSLWLSRRTGIPRKDVLANFGNIAGRFFGDGVTAAQAYDKISTYYKGTGTEAPMTETENPEAFAGLEGLPKSGKGVLLVNAEQSARAAGGGFTGFAQKIPAGIYSQAATLSGVRLKDPVEDQEYMALRRQNEGITNPMQFTEVYGEGMGFGPVTSPDDDALIEENEKKMQAIRARIDAENREMLKAWKSTLKGEISQEYRRLSEFWYELSGEAMTKAGVDPEFQKTTLGQFAASAGSVPATLALAALGPVGAVGMESAFFADVESERQGAEGKAYDPQKAFAANLASAGPQMLLERAFGMERLMAAAVGEVPKIAGKVAFGDFMKQFVRKGLTAGVEEGLTEPAQGFWNDFMASQTFDEKRELFTPEAAKLRLVESITGFTLGFMAGGGISSVESVDQNMTVAKGEKYLTTKEGGVFTPADFAVLRQVKSDEQLMATAPNPETGRLLIAAANGDQAAMEKYNDGVLREKFVSTDGLEVDGWKLGMIEGVPVVENVELGTFSPIDVNNPEERRFLDTLKQRAVAEQATKETLAGLQARMGETLKVERPAMPETLMDRVNKGLMTREQAQGALDVAKLVNGLARETTLETARIQGSADVRATADGVFQMVATVAQAADPTVAIEEVSEAYIKKAYLDQNLKPEELNDVRMKWHSENGEKDVADGLTGEELSRANIEWFSKRVVDYALARRKVALPGGWGKWLRTLGERLKTVIRGAAKMKKLLRDGKLDADLETLMKGALGEVSAGAVRSKLDASKADKARASRQAELDAVFEAEGTKERAQTERVLRSYQGYEALKAQLAEEEQKAALAELRKDRAAEQAAMRERDFIKAQLEEELQAVIEDRLTGAETITENGPLTEEETFVAEMLNDIPVYDLDVTLSPQAERLLKKYEGETEETLTAERRMLDASYRRAAAGNREAAPDASEFDEEMRESIGQDEDFPTITGNDADGYVVKDPEGNDVEGTVKDLDAAFNVALKWFNDSQRAEEMANIREEIGWGDDSELQAAIIRAGGLLAPSQEPMFKGELKSLMENLDTKQKLRLFRKKGKPLDELREALGEDGFEFETTNDLLVALDQSTRGEAVMPTNLGFKGQTFNLTETPAFKKWFGESKVVDEEGKPLVVYHGTPNQFTAFDPAAIGNNFAADERGFFFISTRAMAERYARSDANGMPSEGGQVIAAFVSLQKPLIVDGAFLQSEGMDPIGKRDDAISFWDTYQGLIWEWVDDRKADGVILVDDSTGEKMVVATKPTQIKSATGNRGTFNPRSPDITFSLTETGGRLMALHNTTAEGLRIAAKFGGYAVPSIGVVKAGHVFEGFGDITLIADPRLVDPKKEPVFDSDAYSPRIPRPEYNKVKVKLADGLMKPLKPFAKTFDDAGSLSEIWDYMVNEGNAERAVARAIRSNAVMAAFLAERGVTIDPVIRQSTVEVPEVGMPAFQRYLANGGKLDFAYDDIEGRKAYTEALKEAHQEYVKETTADEEIRGVLSDAFTDQYIDPESGLFSYGRMMRVDRSVANLGKMEVDSYESGKALEAAIASREAEFKAWVESNLLPAFGDPFIKLRGKKLPYTLENIVKAMTGDVRNKEETMTFGEGAARAAVSRQFSDVADMKAAAGMLASEEEVEAAREKTKSLQEKFRLSAVQFYGEPSWGKPSAWDAFDAAMRAQSRMLKSGRWTAESLRKAMWKEDFRRGTIPDEVLEAGVAAAKALVTNPVPYFEAKPQRAVRLREFMAAVIPEGTPADVKAILTEAGMTVSEYAKNTKDSRRLAVAAFTNATFSLSRVPQSDITFATTGIPQNQGQALQAQAMRIQAKRLAASAQLLSQLNSGQPLPARAKAVRKATEASLAAKLFVPLVSRLQAVSAKANLGQRLRRLDFDLNRALKADFEAVKPFMVAFESLPERDARILDLALKNGDTASRDAVLNAYGMAGSFAQVERVLAATRARAIAAGYDVGEIENYFPRKVNDLDGLMIHYYGKPEAGHIEKALQDAAKKAQDQGRILTREERIEVVNSVLRGFRRPESKPGNLKTRKTDVVSVDADQFYADSVEALVSYVESLNNAIEKRRFFGKFSVPVAGAPGAVSSQLALEASIGAYVEDLIATGDITHAQQAEVQAILEARFQHGIQSTFVKNFKALAYITTMGHVTSALTQITDVAFSLYENGVFDTMVAGGKAIARKSKVTRKDLGIEQIAEEFRDAGKLHKALDRTFKLVGIHYLDMIGKETLVNAKFRRMEREAKAGNLSGRSRAIIERAFDPITGAQVITDLAAGKKTEDTLFAVYTVLADYQPLTQSEYPEYYLRHPNGRIFYMLKSFTLKQFDAFRREGITKIVNGNAAQKLEGARNLIHLAGLLFLIGCPVDWLKDFIMGRKPALDDIMVDNLFKLVGVNRWALWRFRESKNPVEAALLLIAPPAPFIVYPATDLIDSAMKIMEGDDIDVTKFETWRALPFVGSPVYWWMGGGADKIEKKEKKESRSR